MKIPDDVLAFALAGTSTPTPKDALDLAAMLDGAVGNSTEADKALVGLAARLRMAAWLAERSAIPRAIGSA